MPERTALLHYSGGSSDKVYLIEKKLAHGVGLYHINFAYGRRTRQLVQSSKTATPVSEWQADRIFSDLYNSKTGEGYRDVTNSSSISVPFLERARTIQGPLAPVSASAPVNPLGTASPARPPSKSAAAAPATEARRARAPKPKPTSPYYIPPREFDD